MSEMARTLLDVENLSVEFQVGESDRKRAVPVLEQVSFSLAPNQTLGLVGESGCGKSVTALSIINLLPKPIARISDGKILYHKQEEVIDITALAPEELYRMRGNRIAMIFQEPMTALNPVYTVEQQIAEVFLLHRPEMTKKERREAVLELLHQVGISDPESRLKAYPHQLSGGMRQRVMIGMALACRPDILIADEPTTALDVTIQAQILELMKELQQQTGMAIIFITHDLGVVAELCDRVVVMYGGKVVENADTVSLFDNPSHPYTMGLMRSIPQLNEGNKGRLKTVEGTVPPPGQRGSGCGFANRCEYARTICREQPPALDPLAGEKGHLAACHFAGKAGVFEQTGER